MSDDKENEMSTKYKINTLINNIQYKLNKRSAYNLNNPNKGNIDMNLFQSFGPTGIIDNSINTKNLKGIKYQYQDTNIYRPSIIQNPKINNYMNDINNNNNLVITAQPELTNNTNLPINEFYLRNIIKDEFTNLILPYQKDVMCNSNLMESKLNEIEKKFQIIINAQNMGNLNDNAKIISAYLCSNLSNDSLNKNIEKLKIEYDSLFEGLQKKIDSLSNQLNMQKMNNDSNFSNIFQKIDNISKKVNENDNKEIKTYVEKNIFDNSINLLNERQNKIINDNENNIRNLNNQIDNNIRNLNNQIDNMNKSLNQYKIDINNDINKINGLSNNINSLRTDFGKITEDVSQIKYQVTPDIINKINSIDLNSLKQQVSPKEFKNLKDNLNICETNLNSIKTMAENSDKTIFDLKKLINNVEEKQNLSNKNIEKVQPLLNENILDKIKNIDKKIEELSKIKISIDTNNNSNNNNNDNNENNNVKKDDNNNNEEKKDEQELFIGGSRRQQRNNKNVNNNNNNTNKNNNNNNLDEKSLNLIKQLEKINLNELQKIDFNNILTQINDLNNENKILSNKINEQNKEISQINEKIKNFQNNKNPFEKNNYNLYKSEIKEDFKSNLFEFNDPYKREPKINDKNINNINNKEKEKDIFNNDKKDKDKNNAIDNNNDLLEDDYDDFDKDFDDNKNDFDINNDKDKDKEKNKDKDKEKNGFDIFDDKKKDDILFNDNNFSDVYNKKNENKKEFGNFDKYAETNILDQIMGIGGSRRNNNDFNKNFNSGGTFITGSISDSKNNNFNLNDNLPVPIPNEDKSKNTSKNTSKNDEIKDK